MEGIDIIQKRRSCRKFLDKSIDKKILLQLVEAGTCAPSASNSQNYRFLIIDNKKEIEEIAKYKSPKNLIKSAAAIIVVFYNIKSHNCSPKEKNIWQKTWIQNCSAATQNILLKATELKIGSCWIAALKEMSKTRLLSYKTWEEILHPYDITNHEISSIIVLGHPQETDNNKYPLGDTSHGNKSVKKNNMEGFLLCKKKN